MRVSVSGLEVWGFPASGNQCTTLMSPHPELKRNTNGAWTLSSRTPNLAKSSDYKTKTTVCT